MTPDAILPALTLIALVADESTALRAAPAANAPVQLKLARGSWLEPRGEAGAWLKVFDHEHARTGYVRPSAVRVHPWSASEVPTFSTLAGFLRDAAGFESLGIAYATAARALEDDPERNAALAEAVGTMADRLARRAGARSMTPDESVALAAQLPVAEGWGVKFVSLERDGAARLCADPGPMRRALDASDPLTRTRAALALTTDACLGDDTTATTRRQWVTWCADVLSRASTDEVPGYVAERVRLRRAEVLAELAFVRARLGQEGAREAAEGASAALLGIDRARVAAEDGASLDRAQVLTSASRWAAAAERPFPPFVRARTNDEGATCLAVGSAERCTFGRVWTASLVASKDAAAVVVQTVPELSELWVLRDDRIDLVLPAAGAFDAGFVEPAGFSPDGTKLLVVRGALKDGASSRWFEVLATADLRATHRVRDPQDSAAFRKWSSPAWVGTTLATR